MIMIQHVLLKSVFNGNLYLQLPYFISGTRLKLEQDNKQKPLEKDWYVLEDAKNTMILNCLTTDLTAVIVLAIICHDYIVE